MTALTGTVCSSSSKPQRVGRIKLAPLDPSRCPWNYRTEMTDLYKLGAPVALNFMMLLPASRQPPADLIGDLSIDCFAFSLRKVFV